MITRKSSLTAVLLFVLQFLSSHAVDEIPLCCLCDECGPALPGRSHMPVRSDGTTCDDVILELADPTNDSTWRSEACAVEQRRYYDRCCNPAHCPKPIEVVAQNIERNYDSYRGVGPACDICPQGKFPQLPHTITAALNLPGNPTCEDLYWIGKVGGIEDKYCNPMKNFFKEPCGCDLEVGDAQDAVIDYSCNTSSSSSSSGSSQATLGGAPESDWVEDSTTGGDGIVDLFPKKIVDDEDDLNEEDRLYQPNGGARGGLHHRRLRGEMFRIVRQQEAPRGTKTTTIA